MSGCTAPIRGHRTASGLAACPVCGGRGYGYRAPVYYFSSNSYAPQSGYISNGSHVGSSARPRWSPDTSSVTYTKDEVRALTPVRNAIESRTQLPPESYDVFLCHAWDDRRGIATELHDRLQTQGVSVWFSEKNIILGQPFLREIDKGLAKSSSLRLFWRGFVVAVCPRRNSRRFLLVIYYSQSYTKRLLTS